MRHVNPYLVGSTGLQLCQHMGMCPVTLDDPVMSSSFFSIRADGHAQAIDRMTADRLINEPPRGKDALTDRLVFSMDIASFNLSNQISVCLQSARHDHQTGCTFVQPVNDTRSRKIRLSGTMVQQRVHQGPPRVTRARAGP